MSNPTITPLHVKVYILLGRASFRLRYQEWKQERKKQAAQAEAAAALEVEQRRSQYQAKDSNSPPDGLRDNLINILQSNTYV